MDIAISQLAGPVTRVALTGRLDAPGADQIGLRFSAGVAAAGHPALVDLSGVDFVASMGIRLLIATARALSQKGAMMVLFGAQPLVQGVFDDAALDQIMPIVGTETEALAALTSA